MSDEDAPDPAASADRRMRRLAQVVDQAFERDRAEARTPRAAGDRPAARKPRPAAPADRGETPFNLPENGDEPAPETLGRAGAAMADLRGRAFRRGAALGAGAGGLAGLLLGAAAALTAAMLTDAPAPQGGGALTPVATIAPRPPPLRGSTPPARVAAAADAEAPRREPEPRPTASRLWAAAAASPPAPWVGPAHVLGAPRLARIPPPRP